MKKYEFLKWFEKYKVFMDVWSVDTDEEEEGDFVLGCFKDEASGKWRVYENGERGGHYICLETDDEEEAFDELKSMVMSVVKMFR